MALTDEQHQVILNSLMQKCGCPLMIEDRLEAFKAGMVAAVNGIRDKITLDEGAIKKKVVNNGKAPRVKSHKSARK